MARPMSDQVLSPDPPGDTGPRAIALAFAVICLGQALQIRDGIIAPGAMIWLSAAVVLCAAGVWGPLPTRIGGGARTLQLVLLACVVWFVVQLFSRPPFNNLPDTSKWHPQLFRAGLSLMSALAIAAVLSPLNIARAIVPLVFVIYFALGTMVIRATPSPDIDVFIFQRDSAAALLGGTNPYTITFPDVYGPGEPWYAPGIARDGRVQFGYPYMPLTLLMTLPGHLLLGDFRFSHLLALVVSCTLIAYLRPARLCIAAALLLLLQPRGFYLIERGWCEPLVVLVLSATVFAALHAPRYLALWFGLLIVSKQYMFATLALTPLLAHSRRWREVGPFLAESAVVALVATLPLAMLALPGFWRSAVVLQFQQPYRWDSLSFPAWLGDGVRAAPWPWWTAFAALGITVAISLARCARNVWGFAGAVAICYLLFFAFGKQAFANYYLVVIAAMCCTIATLPRGAGTET
jgi:hypothetical protein